MKMEKYDDRPEEGKYIPNRDDLVKVWNLLLTYERSPNLESNRLPAALREVRGGAILTDGRGNPLGL